MALTLELWYPFILAAMCVVWVAVYYLRDDLRKKMIVLTALGAISGPVSQIWYTTDYWLPEYLGSAYGVGAQLLQDLAFGGLIIGLTATVYNVFFNMKSVPLRGGKRTGGRGVFRGAVRGLFLAALLVCSLSVFTGVLHLNSIYSSAIGFLIASALIWWKRPDLLKPSLVGFVYFFGMVAVGYNASFVFFPNLITKWWLLQNISGVLFLGVPLEEFLWFSTWGLVGTPLYEWLYDAKFVRRKG